nr:hypothetical protein [Paraburkholderia ginsengisoli]
MRRRDNREARSGSQSYTNVNVEPLRVDRDRHNARAGAVDCAVSSDEAGVFNPHGVPYVGQQARGELDRMLRAGRDHDAIDIAC